MLNLERDLARWDGKSADDIRCVYDRHHDESSFSDSLISLLGSSEFAVGASWLLKHYFEHGGTVDEKQCRTICNALPALSHWAASLHLLQCLPYLIITPQDRQVLELFVREGLGDRNKFVRAWSYNGLYELSKRFPDLRDETRIIFEMALRDEAPSVKARIRQLIKKGV